MTAEVWAAELRWRRRAAGLLQALGEHEQALALLLRAALLAKQDDRYDEALSSRLQALSSMLAMADLRSAGMELERMLGVELDVRPGRPAIEACLQIEVPGATPEAAWKVRCELLLRLGQLRAARGWLRDAAITLDRLLELLEEREHPEIHYPEVQLKIGEILLDAGEFEALETFRVHADSGEPGLERRWNLLDAELLLHRGCYSEVLRLLDKRTWGEGEGTAASLLRFQALASLNRLDDASEELGAIPNSSLWTEQLAVRRSDALRALSIPLTSREMLGGETGAFGVLAGTTKPELLKPERSHERVRVDFSLLFNRVLLAWHRGDNAGALAGSAAAVDIGDETKSALIQARARLLRAFVAYEMQDLPRSMKYAREARRVFEALGMLPDALATARLEASCLLRQAKDGEQSPEVEALAEVSAGLAGRMRAQLDPADRTAWELGQWMETELSASRRLDALRRDLEAATDGAGSDDISATLRDIRGRPRLYGGTSNAESETAPRDLDLFGVAVRETRRSRGLLESTDCAISFRDLPTDCGVLHYVVLPDRLEAFLMTAEGVEWLRTPPCTRRKLWQQAMNALEELAEGDIWSPDSPALAALSASLGLDDVVDKLPREVRTLVVLPDDVLSNVPFPALPARGKALVSRFALASAAAPRWGSAKPFAGTGPLRTLAIADPKADSEKEALPGSFLEMKALIEGFSDAEVLPGKDASRACVLKALPAFELIYCACHGEFFPQHPARSGILLADDWLTLEDLASQDLGAVKVAALTSCWGGSALAIPGVGQFGLPFVLLERGVGSVIACLWEVDDERNIELLRPWMCDVATQGPVRALAHAQARLVPNVPPHVWAGYVAFVAGVPRRPEPR